jgi:hypothetical protein
MGHGVRGLACIFLLVYLVPAGAQSSADAWSNGTRAFELGDYSTALTFFESARDAGQRGPAVHYNIGVSQYKLGQYQRSRHTFELIAKQYPKFLALSEYNLGLIANRQGNTDPARKHFQNAYDLSANDETLSALSATMLARTEPGAKPSPDWFGAIGMRAGYDDNVALRDELGLPVGTTAESPMTDVYGSLEKPFTDKGDFRFDVSLYAVRYFDIDEFDQNAIRAGVAYDHDFGQWRTRVAAYAAYGTLGGDGFDETGSLSFRLDRRLTQSSSLGIRFRYDDVSAAETIFSGIEGSRQRLDAHYRWYAENRSLFINVQVETNDRSDPSVSSSRSKVGIDYRFSPLDGWGYEFGAEYRSSDYDDLIPARTEDLVTLRAGISRMLSQNWQVLAAYLYANNDSSDSTFTYDRNLMTLALMRMF